MTNETKRQTIGGVEYDAERITDSAGIGYFELREPGSSVPMARINYHGPDRSMDVCTYGNALPMPAVAWLISRAESWLSNVDDRETPLGAVAGSFADGNFSWRAAAQKRWARAFEK